MSNSDLGHKVPGATNTFAKTLKQGADMEVQEVHLLKGGSIPLHSHSFGQSYVVTEGSGRLITSNDKSEVSPGTAGYFGPDEPHGWESNGADKLVFISSSASETGIYEGTENSGGKWNIHYHS